MFNNYLKIAIRNVLKNKVFSCINSTGLAIGIACCLLIALWVLDELNVDRFHKDGDHIYQVLVRSGGENVRTTPTPLGPTLQEECPEITDWTRYHWLFERAMLTYDDKSYYEDGLRIADPSFFSIFTFLFLRGDPQTALEDPYSVVMTKATAEKYFSYEDPIGKTVTLNHEHKLTVTGVIENIPRNSTLAFDMVIPMAFRIHSAGSWYMDWNNCFPITFIKLQPEANIEDLHRKMADIIPTHGGGEQVGLTVLPFVQRHFSFYSDITYVYIFSAIAFLILVIACFNFMNLSTARSTNRAREIGMRKISGAFRIHIIVQFMGESLFLSLAALMGALILVAFLLPYFNSLTGKALALSNGALIPFAVAFSCITGVAAGIYPAFVLSGFQPYKVLKGDLTLGVKSSTLRKSLVVIQFSLSIMLIICMLVIYKQLDYIRNKDIGYDKEWLVKIPLRGGSQQYYDVLKSEFLHETSILGITGTQASLPYLSWHQGGFHWKGKDPNENISISCNMIQYDFVETFQIELLEGRDFSHEHAVDATSSCLINEEMMNIMGLETAENAILSQTNQDYTIIGVMKNFHFHTFGNRIEPLVLRFTPGVNYMYIRIAPEAFSSTLAFIRDTWNSTVPNYPFACSFLNDELNRGYRNIERAGTLLNGFALLAVVISCLGLFGLVSFTVQQRTKEIGIRKVLGASVVRVITLLTKDFMMWILLANITAWPAAWYAANKWLQNFAYRIDMNLWVFITAGAIAVAVAMVTVSYQSIKAALANPVNSLRTE
ncbi:MAG: ABC transporter permease [Gemmatimonadota bacterium]|nr:MAG: ABC transporter permease [Gemmatimonadota bacterium]